MMNLTSHRWWHRIDRPNFATLAVAVLLCLASRAGAAVNTYVAFAGEKSAWHDGFDRYDYVMDEESLAIHPFQAPPGEKFGVGSPAKGQRRCIVVVPKQAAPGNPWSWQGCYWDHEPQAEVELLRRGFHVVFITPDPGKPWDAWYDYLTLQHGLSQKPAFVGMSKGGVNAYDWTTANPEKVSCIYADNPAIRPEAFARLDNLARYHVPLLNVCGSHDFLLQRHTLAIEERYRQLGARMTVMIKDGAAHHPHSLRNPKLIADWIERNTLTAATLSRPGFADGSFIKTYFYGHESIPLFLKEENTLAICRGPGFFPCYERYDLKTESQWGLTGLGVIVPTTIAPGQPWVFRSEATGLDSGVDQALLALGYHIVIPPLTAQSGPVQTQWDAVYKLLVGHGFSKRPVLEGTAAAAGEMYAWAVENPEKVSCIYARNPVPRSLMTKQSPLERLEPLVKAGVPLLHVVDQLDPWFNQQHQLIADRIKALGGQLNTMANEGESMLPLSRVEQRRVIDFITEKSLPK